MVYRKRNWDELYKEAMEMLKDGYLIKDISSKLGIYRGTIRCWRDGKTIPAKVKIQNEVLKIREKIIISHI